MFTQLRMTNFKSWQDTGSVRLAPLSAFFGTNSSGKSSLLQMLLLLKQTAESNDRKLVLKTGSLQEGYVNLGTPSEITHRDTTEMLLSITWKFSDDPLSISVPHESRTISLDELEFSTQIHAEPQKIYVDRLIYQGDNEFWVDLKRGGNNRYAFALKIAGREPPRPQGRPRVNMSPEKCYGFSDEALGYYPNTGYLSDMVLRWEKQFQKLHYLGPLREYPQRSYIWGGERPTNVGLRGELAIPALLSAKAERVYSGRGKKPKLEERIAQWLVELGLAHSFRTQPIGSSGAQYEVRIKRDANSPEVLLPDLGIGVSQVLPVLILCYYVPEGSTIILEQPELHLHPSVQSGLADVFIDVIQKRQIQIILESHSEHLLRRLQRRIAEGSLPSEKTAIYFSNLQDGVSHLEALEIDTFGQIRNWPSGFFGDVAGDMVATLDASIERQISKSVR
jgi:predicted ATPase